MRHTESPEGRVADSTVRFRAARAIRLLFWVSIPLWLVVVAAVIPAMSEGDVPVLLWVAGGMLVLLQVVVLFANYGLRCECCGALYFDRLSPVLFYGQQFIDSVPAHCEFCDFERIRKA